METNAASIEKEDKKVLKTILDIMVPDNTAGLNIYDNPVYNTDKEEDEEPKKLHVLELAPHDDYTPIHIASCMVIGSMIDSTKDGRDVIWSKSRHLLKEGHHSTNEYVTIHGDGFEWDGEKLLPDHTRHVYSTMGPNISYINNHNLVFQARTKDINLELLTNQVSLNKDNDYKGIIVIDQYSNYNTREVDIDKIVNYYSQPVNRSTLTREVADHVELVVSGLKHRHDNIRLDFRIITFISAKELEDNCYVYSPEVDLIFNKSVVNVKNGIVHPHSKHRHNRRYDRDVNATYSYIGLVDYVTNKTNVPLFTNIGGKVQVIHPSYDSSVKEGVYTAVYKKGAKYDNVLITPDEYSTYGFYKSREECERAHNIKEQLEMKKLSLEEQQLTLKSQELEHKNNSLEIEVLKLRNDKDKLETETRRRADEHQMFLNKFKLELDLLRYKTNIDKDKLNNEMKFYLYKQKKERERIDLDIQLLILKEQISLSKDLFKFETDVYTMTNKASTDSVSEKIKIMDLLTKGLSLLNLILK